MRSQSDAQLLREYAKRGNEGAFAELVQRHTNLVYSAALRQVQSTDDAAEVAQRAFISLASGAKRLSSLIPENASLAGWLCRSARNLSLNLRRDEFRRQSRERQAMENFDQSANSAVEWECVSPMLDEAMFELSDPEYDALVLRFFKNQDLRTVGEALGVSEDAAQKRVMRALDSLRGSFSKRGISATAATFSIALSANGIQTGPSGLAVTIVKAVALVKTATIPAAAITAAKFAPLSAMQKALTLTASASLAAVGTYLTFHTQTLRSEVQTLQQRQCSSFRAK
jgi:RNA polymerase sigma factor (sigma-70 family)